MREDDVGRGAAGAAARLLAASAFGDKPSESDGETDGAGCCRGGGDSERDPGAGAGAGVAGVAGRAAGVDAWGVEVRGAAAGAGGVRGGGAACGAGAAWGAAGAAARGLTRRLRKGRSVRTADERLTAIA
ncbi:hypothetical protein [Arthrobacter sp. zg-Y1171]|uniref:hypothetical protein n=1 Tax=Arthrobacter sp. zg-Y1171 TaxID=2964610 RepID=UPI00210779E4|nr:hypothetical protein [Arthrobacter sp. zg-Y1171]MCQ1996900.1 hypothetical protein [Arthrobacter sp. zg-Y1171]UWX82486.1 hypothetical protein N2L00_03380 [Arthrobacter sp. zg-Y1171]